MYKQKSKSTMNNQYQWHPICIQNNQSIEFIDTIHRLNQFKKDLCIRTSDYPREGFSETDNIYQINISNIYHPLHHVESYWNVDARNICNWWPSDDEMKKFDEYGWQISRLYICAESTIDTKEKTF